MTAPDHQRAPFLEMKQFRLRCYKKHDISINDKNTVFASLI